METGLTGVDNLNTRNALLQQVLRELTTGLHAIYGDSMPRVFLFGSQARGEAQSDSDIDVLLLFAGPIQPVDEIMRVSGLLADLNLSYGELVSVLPTSEYDFWSSSAPFWRMLRREAKVVALN